MFQNNMKNIHKLTNKNKETYSYTNVLKHTINSSKSIKYNTKMFLCLENFSAYIDDD